MLLTKCPDIVDLSIGEFESLGPDEQAYLFSENLLPTDVLEYLYSFNDIPQEDEDDLFWDYDYDDGYAD